MSQITVVDKYQIEIQHQEAKSFKSKDGVEFNIPEVKERTGWVVIAEYDEYVIPFILPESFDEKKVEKGSTMNVTCFGLEQLKPVMIKNVNRVVPPAKKGSN